MPLVMLQAAGPGRLAFSRDTPGDVVALPLSPGPVGRRVPSTRSWSPLESIDYTWVAERASGTGSSRRSATTRSAGTSTVSPPRPTPGSAAAARVPATCSSAASTPGQQRILIKPTALLFKDPTVSRCTC